MIKVISNYQNEINNTVHYQTYIDSNIDSNISNSSSLLENAAIVPISTASDRVVDGKVNKKDLKNDIKRRIMTIMLNVFKFVSQSFDCYRKTEAYNQLNEEDISSSFVAYMNSNNFNEYINNLKFSNGINKSAMTAFYSKIFCHQLVVNAKTIYDCVKVHQHYAKKLKDNRKKTSINEVSEILSQKLDCANINIKEIGNLIDKFNEIPLIAPSCSSNSKSKSKKRSIVDVNGANDNEESSFISDNDDFNESLSTGNVNVKLGKI
jgi:hypothetical protein